jgi:SOS-response transcriptional repressor LexA
MNISQPVNIEDGNYVLLRNTTQAKNRDIVAAAVIRMGEPDTATLKRYHEDSNGRFLMSESDRETIEISMSESDYVQGIVVAILKPVDD